MPLSDAQREALLQELHGSLPEGMQIDDLLAGELAGPASSERPPVPVWEYAEYAATQPNVSLDDLAQVRFPILSHDGVTTMVTSLSEMTAPGPRESEATHDITYGDVVNLYRLMSERGVMRWNADTLTHEEVVSPALYAEEVHGVWRQGLRATGKE